MAEYLHPGVYASIVSSGVRPIDAVGTSTAAFVGEASRGIPGRAVFLTKVADFERAFGGQQPGDRGYLAQAVEAFFRNGGTRAYAVRVLPSSASVADGGGVATRVTPSAVGREAPPALSFTARGAGAWGNGLRLYIEADPISPAEAFRVRVQLVEEGVTRTVEDFQDLRMDPAAERYAVDIIESTSQYLHASDALAAWLASGAPTDTIDPIAASAPTLVTAAVPAAGVALHEGAVLVWTWWDAASSAAPATLTTTIDAELVELTNALLTAEGGVGAPQIGAFASHRTVAANATVLGALLRASMPTASATNATVTAANAALGPDEQLPAAVENAAPSVEDAVPVTAAQLAALIDAAAAPADLAVGGRLAVTVDGSVVSITAPFTTDDAVPGFVESLDSTRLSVMERPQADVGRVLPGLGFAQTRARGYDENSQANPLARPLTNSVAIRFAGGTDGANPADRPSTTDFLGDAADGTGLHALDRVEVNIVAVPGRTDTDTISGAVAWCDNRGDCVFLADGPGSPDRGFTLSASEARAFIDALPVRSNNAAMYFPWPQEPDPVGVGRNPRRFVPPSGLVAGILARTDNTRGVWKAPAGLEAVVRGAVGLQVDVQDADQDLLNPVGLNCVRLFPGAGVVVWGTRTLASDPEWKYLPVRRTALFLKESIRRGMQWAVFEPNDEDLWRQIELNIHSFLLGLFRQGAFQGTTPEEAFLVQCNRDTNPQELVDQGIVTAKVAFAPLKPAEFVVIEISQKSLLGGS